MIIVDTNLLVDFFRGYDPVVIILLDQQKREPLSISTITALELIQGSRNSSEMQQTQRSLLAVQIIPLDGDIGLLSIELMSKYRLRYGIDLADSLIAATAMISDSELWTRNLRHFSFIEGLRVSDPLRG